MGDIRVAAVIFNALFGEIENNLSRIIRFCEEASKQGASIICFPEMSVTGYSAGKDIIPFSLTLENPYLQTLQNTADTFSLSILAGLSEKDSDGKIFATQAIFIPGKPLGFYRKLHISPPEQAVFTSGSDIPLFETRGIRFGVQLCYDAHFPFLSTRMAENGADILFIPHASPRGTPDEKYASWMRHIPARSYDNGLYVVVCNQTGDNGHGMQFPGLAFVTDPSGHIVARDTTGNEGLLIADLSQNALDHVRSHRMRYFLPNTRKDII